MNVLLSFYPNVSIIVAATLPLRIRTNVPDEKGKKWSNVAEFLRDMLPGFSCRLTAFLEKLSLKTDM
jgi:hypothetical protein